MTVEINDSSFQLANHPLDWKKRSVLLNLVPRGCPGLDMRRVELSIKFQPSTSFSKVEPSKDPNIVYKTPISVLGIQCNNPVKQRPVCQLCQFNSHDSTRSTLSLENFRKSTTQSLQSR